jgi:hypothetical protein
LIISPRDLAAALAVGCAFDVLHGETGGWHRRLVLARRTLLSVTLGTAPFAGLLNLL